MADYKCSRALKFLFQSWNEENPRSRSRCLIQMFGSSQNFLYFSHECFSIFIKSVLQCILSALHCGKRFKFSEFQHQKQESKSRKFSLPTQPLRLTRLSLPFCLHFISSTSCEALCFSIINKFSILTLQIQNVSTFSFFTSAVKVTFDCTNTTSLSLKDLFTHCSSC